MSLGRSSPGSPSLLLNRRSGQSVAGNVARQSAFVQLRTQFCFATVELGGVRSGLTACGRRRTPGSARCARLRRGYVAGRLDTDTFSRRVERALRRRSRRPSCTASRPTCRRPRALPPRAGSGAGGRRLCSRPRRRPARARAAPPAASSCSPTTPSRAATPSCASHDGRWMLRDLGSSNGTWVNGRRVMEAEVAAGRRGAARRLPLSRTLSERLGGACQASPGARGCARPRCGSRARTRRGSSSRCA